MLDSMDIERERGITIKAQTVRLDYTALDGKTYVLNLMDTPGHVDFAYEVSRSLAACEGSLLVVDASQGVEAQTLANAYHAIDANHEIIPVLNKIDLPSADAERVCKEIEDVIGIDTSDAVQVSAKTGFGIDDLLEAMVKRLPPPKGDRNAPLKALLVDSWYDPYLGVVTLVRVKDGVLKKGMRIRMMAAAASYDLDKVGVFTPKAKDVAELGPGEIGFIIAGIKTIADCKVGDTITDDRKPATEMLAGFKPSVPVVFCGLFPADAAEFEQLRESLSKLRLNDSSFHFEPEIERGAGLRLPLRLPGPAASRDRAGAAGARVRPRPRHHRALGRLQAQDDRRHGARAAQSGRLSRPDADREHAGAVDQGHDHDARRASRLGADALPGAARPADRAHLCRHARHGDLSPAAERGGVRLLRPAEVGDARLCQLRLRDGGLRGRRAGEAHHPGERRAGRCALASSCTRTQAESRGRALCERLKDLIPRQLFKIAIQAAIGGRIIARETISALRKDVLAKCYGGDISRKKKLLEKQKKGKKRMRQVGDVEIPQSAFIAALKMDSR